MTLLLPAETHLLKKNGLDPKDLESLVTHMTHGADDGELYLEYGETESLIFEDGRIKSASYDGSGGFGMRAVLGEAVGYAYGTELTSDSLKKGSQMARQVTRGTSGSIRLPGVPALSLPPLYRSENPLLGWSFEKKVALLQEIDTYARQQDARVCQVTITLGANWKCVGIFRPGTSPLFDVRPLIRFGITVVVQEADKRESGSHAGGGRMGYEEWLVPSQWQSFAREAIRQATTNLEAVPAPVGEMPVILGPGWPGILLHEAVGHGLEGDFNRKKTSHFSHLMGQKVAASGVTVVDDGTIPYRRGSLLTDDEGTPTQRTVLIEDGVLVGYLQDRQNGRLMGTRSTGNGRRESYAHAPMPRMTNTMMLAGQEDPQDILRSVSKGIYAANFKGGQVDITSGQFVFEASEAYLVENGQIGAPIKGATLIGNGPQIMGSITKIGSDFQLDPGVGTCGKEGQSVPVGVGQPTLLISSMTVGG
jgi:TldD protein